MRYSPAYLALLNGIAEVRLIEGQARRLERRDPVANGSRALALVRGGLVLLCSHLEAYVKSLIEITVQEFYNNRICISKLPKRAIYFSSQDIIREIKETNDPDRLGEKIIAFQMKYGNNVLESGPLSGAFHWDVFETGFSTPNFRNIDRFLKRVGYSTLSNDLGRRQQNKYLIIKNAIDHLVDVRNAIAHGDQNERKTPAELADLISNVQIFCRDLDDVYCSWCKSHLCTIRR